MFINARDAQKKFTRTIDICKVGTCAAGMTLAKVFSISAMQITVLESSDFERATQDLYIGNNIGEKFGDLDKVRFRRFGGTTNAWHRNTHFNNYRASIATVR